MTNDQIKSAVAYFEQLLLSQVERAEKLNQPKTSKANGATVIGIIDGDGIGPIIMNEARRALKAVLKDEIANGTVILKDIEGLTIENRLALGKSVPDDTMAAIKTCDVLLKGPTTTPSGGLADKKNTGNGAMESANVSLRRALDLYANTRPVVVPEEGIDWMFFRENTEGEYTLGSKGIELEGLMTMDFKVTTIAGTRRIARAAYEYARKNGKKRVSIITKSNIMKKTDGMFSKIAHEVAAEYPEIETDEYYIDIMTANLVNKAIRNQFQVFLLPNLYGDIITDEAAQIQGGVGTAGSSNVGDQYAMFEAIHGSAPRLIEMGLGDYANPESILTAACMLLDHIGLQSKAAQLRAAMAKAHAAAAVTGDRDGATCAAYGDALIANL